MNIKHSPSILKNVKWLCKKHGYISLGAFTLLIVMVITGWQCHHKKRLQENINAAELYQKLSVTIEKASKKKHAIINQATSIINLYYKSIYADFANLEIAKQAVLKNDLIEAKQALKQVINNSNNCNLRAIAILSLARIETTWNDSQSAIYRLNNLSSSGYNILKNTLLGHAYLAQKNFVNAKYHWQQATKKMQNRFDLKYLNKVLQVQIDNLVVL